MTASNVLFILSCLLLAASLSSASPPPTSSPCPEESSSFRIVGTRSVQTLTRAWKDAYLETVVNDTNCPTGADLEIDIGGYTWPSGAARVCGIHPIYGDADIAGMSGPFFDPQASTTNGWSFECKFGSKRKTILLEVAHEGIAVVTAANGAASQCVELLGGSLSIDQLRWIFSSYTMSQLLQRGMDPDSVPNSDGDDTTHLWSELHENCTSSEIQLVWVDWSIGAVEFISDHVLNGPGETLATQRGAYHVSHQVEGAVQYLTENPNAISYLQLGDLHAPVMTQRADELAPVPIRNKKGEAIPPEADSFDEHIYPLGRAMYLGVWDDPDVLKLTAPFIQFGFSEEGTRLLQQAGFWSIDVWKRIVMQTRLQIDGGVPMDQITSSCGREYGTIAMAGSATVFPVARIWSEIYKLGCPTVEIEIDQGGSSAGAGRVCANMDKGDPVDIGNMSREWKTKEGLSRNEKGLAHVYDCRKGDKTRSAVRVDIAKDGLTVILKKGGIADQCQQILGGFTIDQLRWIYSSYTEAQLQQTGWDPASLKNSDNDPSTHLWSELDPGCAAEEIHLTGDILNEGTHTNFRKTIMADKDSDEDIDLERPLGYFQALGFKLVAYLQSHGDAISYIGYNYYFDNKELLSVAPIRNSAGVYVTPSAATIGDGSYNPLVRSISMNLWNDPQALKDTVPLLWFGFSNPDLVTATGMVPVQGASLKEMLDRLAKAMDGDVAMAEISSGSSLSSQWRMSTAVATTMLLVLAL